MTDLQGRFSNTERILAQIFQSTFEDVRKSVNSLWTSAPPEEEPLTFHSSLCLISKLTDSKPQVLSKVRDDLCKIGRRWHSYSYEPPNNLNSLVEVKVVPHHKRFEGKVSGADFGLVLTIPVASKLPNTFKVESRSAGCIIQAKRILTTGTRRRSSCLGRGFSHLMEHQDFALFVLYYFSRNDKNKPYAFENTFFVHCRDFKADSFDGLKAAVKESFNSSAPWSLQRIEARDVVEGVLSEKFSTSKEKDIQEIIGLSRLPILHIQIRFPEWKPPPPPPIRIKTKNDELQTVSTKA